MLFLWHFFPFDITHGTVSVAYVCPTFSAIVAVFVILVFMTQQQTVISIKIQSLVCVAWLL